jgi:hypothetical protein
MARITQRNLMWSAAALLGIAATAAIAWAASQLARQPIGLSSDPISVANGLAPALPRDSHPAHPAALAPVGTAAHPRERERRDRHHARVLPPPAPSSPATATTVITSAWTSAPAAAGSSATAASPAAGSTAAAPPPARNHEDSGDGGSHRDD